MSTTGPNVVCCACGKKLGSRDYLSPPLCLACAEVAVLEDPSLQRRLDGRDPFMQQNTADVVRRWWSMSNQERRAARTRLPFGVLDAR
jgi:hypothetical protein